MDGPQAEAMFEGAFARWLRRRLSGGEREAGPIGVLAAEDPLGIVGTLRELAQLRRSRPTARPPTVDLNLRPDLEFIDAVDAFERWFVERSGGAQDGGPVGRTARPGGVLPRQPRPAPHLRGALALGPPAPHQLHERQRPRLASLFP